MSEGTKRIRTLDELRHYVQQTLCDREQLEFGAFGFSERILVRAGRPCGIFFCVHGPRAVMFTAIWETTRNTILFYTSTGERFQKVQLAAAPQLEATAA